MSIATYQTLRVILTPKEYASQGRGPSFKELEEKLAGAPLPLSSTKIKQPFRTTTPLPPRLRYPKQWRDLRQAGISLPGPGTQVVIGASPGCRTFITAIVFTVTGPTTLRFGFGNFGHSGPMEFGDADEPRAMVIAMSDSPSPCGSGSFSVTSDGVTVAVGGWVTYYLEPDEPPL